MNRREFLIMAAASAMAQMGTALADPYPTKPIKLIVPFAPGGGADSVARLISEALAQELGQPVVVENKGGAGGVIGTMELVRAVPDGHTLLMATMSITGANPAINPKSPYDPTTDVTAIIDVAASPSVLAVREGFPAKNYKDFIAEVRKNPGRYTYASSGVGSIIHLFMEYYCQLTGTSIRHIPFSGAGPAKNAVIAGQVDMVYDTPNSVLPFIKSGKLVPIAVSSPERWRDLPDTPTFREVGVDRMTQMPNFGLLGPKAMPREIVDKINSATRKALADPAVRGRIEDSGAIIIGSTPDEYAAEIKSLLGNLKTVVAERKLTME